MANVVDIVLKGVDQASGAIANVNRELDGMGGKPATLNTAFSGLGKVIAGLGLAGLAAGAAKAVIALGQMGEESAQLDAKFQAVSGSANTARARFSEMDEAVGNWLTRDAKMEASIRIMSLGLADSAEGAGELARTAILLGDSTQTAEERIDSFTQMLATGQTRGLASFGISVIDVKNRVAELTDADENLTAQMATQQAVMEAAAERAALLGDYLPITKTEQMANATADLKDSLGDLVAQPYVVSVEFLTAGIENVIGLLNRTSNDAGQQLSGLEQQLKDAKAEYAQMQGASGKGILGGLFNQKASEEQLATVQKTIDELTAKVEYMKTVNADSGDVGVAALDKQSNAAILLKDNLQAVEDKYLEIEEKTKPTAEGAERTQVDAAGLVGNLQKGLLSADVIGALDVDKLANEPGMAGLARKTFAAFGKALDANAADAPNVADKLIGFKADEKGVSPADTAAQKAVETLAGAIGATVKSEDFAGKMIGYGETIWGYTEAGMIGKAKTSTAFQSAIDAMVNAAISAALGGP